MADLAKIKRNVARMAAQNAPEEDIDGYIASEGVTFEDLKNYQKFDEAATGAVSSFAHGGSLGLADKVGGAIYGAGAAAVDAYHGKPYIEAFKDRYNELVGDSKEQREKFANNHPVAAFGLEMGGNVAGAGRAIYKHLADKGVKGVRLLAGSAGLEGGIQSGVDSEMAEDVPANILTGGAFSAALGYGGNKILSGLKKADFVLQPFQNRYLRAADAMKKIIGEDDLRKAMADTRRFSNDLAEVGNSKINRLAKIVREQTPEASDVFEIRLLEINQENPDYARGIVNLTLGKKTKLGNIEDITTAAKKQADPYYKQLEKMGDLEIWEIGQRLKNASAQSIKTIKRTRPEEYNAYVQEVAKREKLKLLGDIEHFTKDAKRNQYLNTLGSTAKNPDLSATLTDKDGKIKQYLVKKYNNQFGQDIYDLIIKQDDGIYNKFPTNLRYAAKQFKEPLDDLSVNGTQSGNMGISPSPEGKYILSDLGRFVNENEYLQNIIKRIRKNPVVDSLHPGMRQAANTDFSLLNQAKKEIDREISLLAKNRSANREYIAEREIVKKNLVDMIDKATDGLYSKTLKIYEDQGKYLHAQKIADDIFDPKVSSEVFNKKVAEMSPLELESLKIGLRDNLLSKLDSKNNENLAYNIFKQAGVKNKLKQVLREIDYDTLTKYADARINSYRNYNKILGGSQTSSNQMVRDALNPDLQDTFDIAVKVGKQPMGSIGLFLERLSAPWKNSKNKAIAELLTEKNPYMLNSRLNNALNKLSQREQNKLMAKILLSPALPALPVVGMNAAKN